VVIESDDWGSIRIPSKEVYQTFISKGFDFSDSTYNRIDTLESNDDLSMLYEVLHSLKDSYGNHPVITANMITGNPDFNRIRQSEFKEYYFEPVTDTLKRYPQRDAVEALWKQGNSDGIFHPQFHGREHVNIVRWMDALRNRSKEIMFTFDHETTFSGKGDYNYMEVLDSNKPEDLILMKRSIAEGLNIFEDIFGFRSKSFIAPCYTWNSELEKTLYDNGVKFLQGLVVQLIPNGSFGDYKKRYHFTGTRNQQGQIFLVRNCYFEPSLNPDIDNVVECLNRIKIAFRWKKPAIISSHRLNYIGILDENNRKRNLTLLEDLLKKILKLWPDVAFMTSDALGELIGGSTHEKTLVNGK
jgi:hypothetical protein